MTTALKHDTNIWQMSLYLFHAQPSPNTNTTMIQIWRLTPGKQSNRNWKDATNEFIND